MQSNLTQEWKIKDLKGVGDVELSLDASKRVFVFFGSNGVGKTKTLEALALFCLANTHNFIPNRQAWSGKEKLLSMISFNSKDLVFDDLNADYIAFPNLFNQIENKSFLAFSYLGATNRSQTKQNHRKKSLGNFITRKENISKEISDAIQQNKLHDLGMNQDIHQWFVERAQSVNPY